jgi:hypothetical protein
MGGSTQRVRGRTKARQPHQEVNGTFQVETSGDRGIFQPILGQGIEDRSVETLLQ